MSGPKYHVFICDGTKCSGKREGVCFQKGSENIINKLDELIKKYQLSDSVLVNSCGCFRYRISKKGPNMVIYPQGIWYGGVSVHDVEEIVKTHFVEEKTVDRLLLSL